MLSKEKVRILVVDIYLGTEGVLTRDINSKNMYRCYFLMSRIFFHTEKIALREGNLDYENKFICEFFGNGEVIENKWISWTGLDNEILNGIGLGNIK